MAKKLDNTAREWSVEATRILPVWLCVTTMQVTLQTPDAVQNDVNVNISVNYLFNAILVAQSQLFSHLRLGYNNKAAADCFKFGCDWFLCPVASKIQMLLQYQLIFPFELNCTYIFW